MNEDSATYRCSGGCGEKLEELSNSIDSFEEMVSKESKVVFLGSGIDSFLLGISDRFKGCDDCICEDYEPLRQAAFILDSYLKMREMSTGKKRDDVGKVAYRLLRKTVRQ